MKGATLWNFSSVLKWNDEIMSKGKPPKLKTKVNKEYFDSIISFL